MIEPWASYGPVAGHSAVWRWMPTVPSSPVVNRFHVPACSNTCGDSSFVFSTGA